MKLYLYRGAEPNFGDELNAWLMPRVLPGLLDESEDELLLGIGSVLFDIHPAAATKIVLGSGYGGYTAAPQIDATWDVRCVRGPITAQRLGLSPALVAGDTAILLRNHYAPERSGAGGVSFMPHFQSIARGHWPEVCARAGIRFIDPRLPVEQVLAMLSDSALVVTEAMHGAVVADALRVPWIAITPFDAGHHMKWRDWAGALDLTVRFHDAAPSSSRELAFARRGRETGLLKRPPAMLSAALKPVEPMLVARAAKTLARIAREEPQLSAETAIADATDRLEQAAAGIRRDYGARARQAGGTIMAQLIYDVGVNDGSDTAYYLRRGCDVLGIEASPRMIERLELKFAREIANGRLRLLNVGVADRDGALTFWMSEQHEWSSFDRAVASRNGTAHEAIEVPTRTFQSIVSEYGVPHYCKIDIEGNDWLCLAGMTVATAPHYVSIEMSHAAGDAHLRMLRDLGYTDFKIVSQVTRAQPVRLLTKLGYALPRRAARLVRKATRRLLGTARSGDWAFPRNSSGPFGEETPGRWHSFDRTVRLWRFLHDLDARHGASGLGEWFDIHARRRA